MRNVLVAILMVAFLGAAGPLSASAFQAVGAALSVRGSAPMPPGWTNVTHSSAPPSMAGGMMAYSSSAGLFVLFGGWNGTALDATWIFDPALQTWSQVDASPRPPSRGDGTFIYDASNDVFLLFGGWHELANETYVRLDDTWIFSLASRSWSQAHPATAPSPRSDSAIAYDSADRVALLLGGFDGMSYLGDAWSYDVPNDTWSPHASPVMPTPRADGRMVYDEQDGLFYLFGGNDYSDANFNFHHLSDMWTYSWRTNTWSEISTANSPSARDYAVLVYNPDADALFLIGGYGNRTILGDTWAFDRASQHWTKVETNVAPPPRYAGVGGYDLRDKIVVLFGGLGNQGLLADTWVLRHLPAPSAQGFSIAPSTGPVLVALILLGFFVVLVLAGVLAPQRSRTQGPTTGFSEESAEARSGDPEADLDGHN